MIQEHELMELLEKLYEALDGAALIRWEPDHGLFVWVPRTSLYEVYIFGADAELAGKLTLPPVKALCDRDHDWVNRQIGIYVEESREARHADSLQSQGGSDDVPF